MENKTVWDFVEQYYPNYYSCDAIAENDDINKLVNNELEEDHELYLEVESVVNNDYNTFKGDLDFEELFAIESQSKLNASNAMVYEKAIQGYLKTKNNENNRH